MESIQAKDHDLKLISYNDFGLQNISKIVLIALQ